MKRAFLSLAALALASCSPPVEPVPEAAPATPPAQAVAKPTPKPGDWMWKEHGNPLGQKPKH